MQIKVKFLKIYSIILLTLTRFCILGLSNEMQNSANDAIVEGSPMKSIDLSRIGSAFCMHSATRLMSMMDHMPSSFIVISRSSVTFR